MIVKFNSAHSYVVNVSLFFIFFFIYNVFWMFKVRNVKCLHYQSIEFKEFEPRFKSTKTRFNSSAGLNLETFDTILSGTNHI